ncbi:MAG: elongation factor P maturation arginine rhamnosyltransferase EarP [Betaproteobacteria bacterium]|nr:elongation factor P maturation arginine rhamnosyltransferase EarP [Betaproteobacteria bacterium]
MSKPASCDIFCNVIDNYGDIGVCWRLARQLAHEHGMAVRLWVDDLASFRRLCPEADAQLAQQRCRGVEIRHWASLFPEVEPAHLVIEAFACELPEPYIAAMAAQEHEPVWINLEYLSAEDWVEGCHKLPSPHPSLPLTKYFFFPGFTPQTGGLLLERDLLARRDAFQNDAAQQQAFWQSIGMAPPKPEETCISLFCYENLALPELLGAWAAGNASILCLVPEGRILPQVGQYFGDAVPCAGKGYLSGNLQVRVLPFVEQERYDELLWACDINFVRGEDSCVRAQWAGKPFVWHIYPQHDNVHMQKLRAFMALYCAGLPPEAGRALHELWEAWNGGQALSDGWNDFSAQRSMLRQHAIDWAQELSGNSLALNLLDFFRSIDKMRGFKI